MMRIGSHRVFTTAIRIVQEVTQLTDGQRREIYLSPIIIGPAIAVLVEPTATALCSIYTHIFVYFQRLSYFVAFNLGKKQKPDPCECFCWQREDDPTNKQPDSSGQYSTNEQPDPMSAFDDKKKSLAVRSWGHLLSANRTTHMDMRSQAVRF